MRGDSIQAHYVPSIVGELFLSEIQGDKAGLSHKPWHLLVYSTTSSITTDRIASLHTNIVFRASSQCRYFAFYLSLLQQHRYDCLIHKSCGHFTLPPHNCDTCNLTGVGVDASAIDPSALRRQPARIFHLSLGRKKNRVLTLNLESWKSKNNKRSEKSKEDDNG